MVKNVTCYSMYSDTIGRPTLVGQGPMKSLSSVCPSVCLSVRSSIRPSLDFLKIGSLVFSDILHDDSSIYIVTYKARFLKKQLAAQIGTQLT